MRFYPLFVTVALLIATPSFAQIIGKHGTKEDNTNETSVSPQTFHKSKVPLWLDLSVGLNIVNCYDIGTIPFDYIGLGYHAGVGATINWERYHIQSEVQFYDNTFSSLNGSSTNVNLMAEFLYRFHDMAHDRLHLWAGGAFQGFMDSRDIPLLQNAAISYSLFGDLCATGMVQYDFAFIPEGSYHLRNLLTTYSKLSLPLLGVVNRPRYSYIGNPTIYENAVLDDNETFTKLLPGISTEFGIYLNLSNDNRIGFSYRWDYLTTGRKGAYRYDNALHSINLNLMFNIN